MPRHRVHFPGSTGESLTAILEMPNGKPSAFALFAHCFTCSKDLKGAVYLSRELAGRGVATLRFDFTGLGESEGDFAETNFSSNVGDLVAAAEYLRTEHEAPQLLVGHSLGGAAVLAAAAQIPESRAVATVGAPSSTEHLGDMLRETAPEIDQAGEAEVNLAGRSFRVRKQLLEDLAETRLQPRLDGLDRPLLIFHSPLDQVVGNDHARRIYEGAKHPKSFLSLAGADHLLTPPGSAEYVARVIAAWASRLV